MVEEKPVPGNWDSLLGSDKLLKLVAIEVVNIMISRLVYIVFLLETLLELLNLHGKVEIVLLLQGSKLFL